MPTYIHLRASGHLAARLHGLAAKNWKQSREEKNKADLQDLPKLELSPWEPEQLRGIGNGKLEPCSSRLPICI